MKELFQGRRFGFAPRPALAFIAVGIGIGVTLADLMAWFAWGSTSTNGFVIVAYWLTIATAVVCAIAMLAAIAAAAAAPAPFLVAVAGLVVLLADASVAANLYSEREWEEPEDEPRERRLPRRRAVTR